MSLTFSLVLTVEGHDVFVRGTADQTVGELAKRLAAYLGLPGSAPALVVQRTGEQLRPESPLHAVDLLEGDYVRVLTPRSSRSRPNWADDDASSGSVIPLRPR